jgi:hypothetical protein
MLQTSSSVASIAAAAATAQHNIRYMPEAAKGALEQAASATKGTTFASHTKET